MSAQETGQREKACSIDPNGPRDGTENRRHVARLVLVVFLITFTVFRILIFLIMGRTLPDMFVHIGGTHVHHLNLGIFLLSVVGGYLLFVRPKGRILEWLAVLYGIGLALTFDEFGMWLHLGGGYWQRASFDAITVVAGFLALMAFGPSVKEMRGAHAITIALLLILAAAFFSLLFQTVNKYGGKMHPRTQKPGQAQSQREGASGTAARSTSPMAPLTKALRQTPLRGLPLSR